MKCNQTWLKSTILNIIVHVVYFLIRSIIFPQHETNLGDWNIITPITSWSQGQGVKQKKNNLTKERITELKNKKNYLSQHLSWNRLQRTEDRDLNYSLEFFQKIDTTGTNSGKVGFFLEVLFKSKNQITKDLIILVWQRTCIFNLGDFNGLVSLSQP